MSHATDQRAPVARGRRFTFPAVTVLAVIVCLRAVFPTPVSNWLASGDKIQTASTVFIGIFVQATPFLVLGVLVSGLIAGFVSPLALARLLPKSPGVAVTVAAASGAALPGCECSSVPVASRLIDRGAPDAVALTFLLAAPAINTVVIIATFVAFPTEPKMALARLVGSLVTALIVGWLWIAIGKPQWIRRRSDDSLAKDLPPTLAGRLALVADTARHDLLTAAPYLAIGAGFASALHVLVPASWFAHLAGHLIAAIVVMAALAVVLALCSEADAFVAASMTALPLTARLVFLVVGPAVDVKLMAMQAGAFGRGFLIRFAPLTMGVAVLSATVVGGAILGWR